MRKRCLVNLTISLSEDTVRRLRRTIRDRYGSRRGALSGLVEEAIIEALGRFDAPSPRERFRALKDGKVLAEADHLDQLASELRNLNVDPRSVRILSSNYLPTLVRAGFRAKKT
jgi:hypothetical protein